MNAFPNENALIEGSLAGQREAFREIVAKYQSLVCSVAYSVTGDLAESEDLAQETFLVAWRKLDTLEDRSKLGPWLCGILKNIARDSHRRGKRDLLHDAAPLDEAVVSANVAELSDKTTQSEREAVMWAALEVIPETYREPLILFYRQGESIRGVAAALDLSEDAAKQRLSRGRKMLKLQVAALVEKALADSGPSSAFTIAVVAALPALATSSSAAAASAAAAAAKGVVKAALLTMMLGGVAFMTLGLFNMWLMVRSAPTARARRGMIKGMAVFISGLWGFVGVLCVGGLVYSGGQTALLTAIGLSWAVLAALAIAFIARSKRAAAPSESLAPFFAWTSAITIAGSLAFIASTVVWVLPFLAISHGVCALIFFRGLRMQDPVEVSSTAQPNYSPPWSLVIPGCMFLVAAPFVWNFGAGLVEGDYVTMITLSPILITLALILLSVFAGATKMINTQDKKQVGHKEKGHDSDEK